MRQGHVALPYYFLLNIYGMRNYVNLVDDLCYDPLISQY